MISMLFLNKTLFEVFDYFSLLAIYSEPLCALMPHLVVGGHICFFMFIVSLFAIHHESKTFSPASIDLVSKTQNWKRIIYTTFEKCYYVRGFKENIHIFY